MQSLSGYVLVDMPRETKRQGETRREAQQKNKDDIVMGRTIVLKRGQKYQFKEYIVLKTAQMSLIK